jgi:Zn-dependent M28 family amino/carboxypeptidase
MPASPRRPTGVAATLALARRFAAAKPARTLRFVAFVNEEPPCFQTDTMGSAVYAKACREAGDDVRAMVSLETLGCYFDAPGWQQYPAPGLSLAYPSRGNYVAFVGNSASKALVREAVGTFRAHCAFPSEGTALPEWVPGVGWSDHWAFWREGFPALMVTDTAPFRYAEYHTARDTPDRIDYERLARVVSGLVHVVGRLAAPPDE